jgi:hypothetical protein
LRLGGGAASADAAILEPDVDGLTYDATFYNLLLADLMTR